MSPYVRPDAAMPMGGRAFHALRLWMARALW